MFTALHSADKFSNEQQILGLTLLDFGISSSIFCLGFPANVRPRSVQRRRRRRQQQRRKRQPQEAAQGERAGAQESAVGQWNRVRRKGCYSEFRL